MGIGEVALLPLDVLKIKAQTNPDAIASRGLFSILKEEKVSALRATLIEISMGLSRTFYLSGLIIDGALEGRSLS